jgi:APA family basic amino acid/polyamine antiporter
MISMFAALNGTVMGGSRIPFAMARDGLFFASAGKIHAKFQTPAAAIWFLTGTSCLLVLSGRYEQLFTSVVFSSWILYTMAAVSVFVFRKKYPNAKGGYLAIGYPWVPALFVVTAMALLGATLIKSPRESLLGLGIIVLGVPFYRHWKGKSTTSAETVTR